MKPQLRAKAVSPAVEHTGEPHPIAEPDDVVVAVSPIRRIVDDAHEGVTAVVRLNDTERVGPDQHCH